MDASIVTSADWSAVIDAIAAQMNVSSVVGVLTSVIVACAGLAFMWWGVRKASDALMSAFENGKISL